MYIDPLGLKGQSNKIFNLQFFFHNSNLPGPLANGLTKFYFGKEFSELFKFFNLHGVLYPGESVF